MTVFVCILSALAAFLLGFFGGTIFMPAAKPIKKEIHRKTDSELERLKKEYSNFLSYDGSEQP